MSQDTKRNKEWLKEQCPVCKGARFVLRRGMAGKKFKTRCPWCSSMGTRIRVPRRGRFRRKPKLTKRERGPLNVLKDVGPTGVLRLAPNDSGRPRTAEKVDWNQDGRRRAVR